MTAGIDHETIVSTLNLIESHIAAIRRAIGAEKGPIPNRVQPDLLDPDLIDLASVAKAMRRSKEATRKWLRRRGLIELIGGRVFVRESRLRGCLSHPRYRVPNG